MDQVDLGGCVRLRARSRALDGRSTILRDVPTDAQLTLTLTLLRIAEAQNDPPPPLAPPSYAAAASSDSEPERNSVVVPLSDAITTEQVDVGADADVRDAPHRGACNGRSARPRRRMVLENRMTQGG
jgi:hypothetical protein